MKLPHGLFLLVTAGNLAAVAAQTSYACPAVGAETTITDTSGIARLAVPAGGLCTLVRRDAATGGRRAPVARSYTGKDWERSAGLFAHPTSGLGVDCASAPSGECDVTLPALESGTEYVLESFERTFASPDAEAETKAARFLEQATFGSTRASIDALKDGGNDFEQWVKDQIALPPSSLREFYRRHTNPKWEFSYVVGAVGKGPCEEHSRWRTYAITSRDMLDDRKVSLNKYLIITQEAGGYVWRVDGQVRTVTTAAPADVDGNALVPGVRYRLENRASRTWMSDCVGCPFWVRAPLPDGSYDAYVEVANPAVSGTPADVAALSLDVVELPYDFGSADLPSIEDCTDYPLFNEWIKPNENALLNTTALEESSVCDGLPDWRNPLPWTAAGAQPGTFPSIFGTTPDGVVLLYDRHLTLPENTVENPLPDGGGSLVLDTWRLRGAGEQVKCHNAERNFYNDEHCALSTLPTTCTPDNAKPNKVIVLNDENLAGMRADTGLALYAVKGLTLDHNLFDATTGFHSPCADTSLNQWSRWIKIDDAACDNTASLGSGTYNIYQNFIEGARFVGNANMDVIDANREHKMCDVEDQSKTHLGKVQAYDGSCWEHVHPSEMDVYDLTGADPSMYTIDGSTATFASTADFDTSVQTTHTVIGKLGDHVEINDELPAPLDDPDLQDKYENLEFNPHRRHVLVCGSPEEVSSDPWNGDKGFDVTVPEGSAWRTASNFELSAQKHTVWTHMKLHAEDQLRMKAAWSLSQIVSVGLPNEKESYDFEETEAYLAFYDHFVKNGLGNYRQLMKEFSYNVIMANWLSFEDNRSLQWNIENNDRADYPDENFAREILQLFSIGLHQLNPDGSIKLDDSGNALDTYSIEDILSYARAWTGMVERNDRGGTATGERGFGDSTLDPLRIRMDRRDVFPKSDLLGGFVGDKVPLCGDLPSKHFLRKGATYILLGSECIPSMHADPEEWSKNPDFAHVELTSTSPLYTKLCQPNLISGDCELPAKVTLAENLAYDTATAQAGSEFAPDTLRTVKIKHGSGYIWYEYVRQPCVEQSFYQDGKRLTQDKISGNGIQHASLCGNPLLEIATPMCSEAGWETESKDGAIFCNYQGERVTYASAGAICAAQGLEQGYAGIIKEWKAGPCADGINDKDFRSWANEACGLKVKISFESGHVAIVHDPEPDRSGAKKVENLVDIDTLNFFAVPWEDGAYPSTSECESIGCVVHTEVHPDEYCLCSTDTTDALVYSSTADVQSLNDLMNSLHVGAADPSSFDAASYENLGSCGIDGATVYSPAGEGGSCASLSIDTVFSLTRMSKSYHLKNVKSSVTIPGTTFAFRNPVQFVSLSEPEKRDAYHETDAVLDSLFYHPSHAPFLAVRMLQRFGHSNPSPGFVQRVTTAYSSGSYNGIGSGEYGDLGAMVAAILLDDESREPVLDADQSAGQLREPLLKVLSFFRGMGLTYDQPLIYPGLFNLQNKIGQGSFENPSVFSFFKPEFAPPGDVLGAGLVAPEGMVLQGSNILHLLDAFSSTVKMGVADCHKMTSFEAYKVYPFACPSSEGDYSLSPATLSFVPQLDTTLDAIVDELDLLLASGRLAGSSNRALIMSEVQSIFDAGDTDKAVRAAQQLILSTPEYHSTSIPRKQDDTRVIEGYTEKPKAPYKAVVVLMLRGGVDSWNMLVPQCGNSTSGLYGDYVAARGEGHAIPKESLIDLDATGSGQTCNTFGLNENLPILGSLYNQGQATFFANTGTLGKPVKNTDNWKAENGFRPFAHNTMQGSFLTGDTFREKPGTGVMGRMLDKLKLQGLQTSANDVVGGGEEMLSGDPLSSNPVWTVSTSDPKDLNKYPTIDNLYDVVKQLNGQGDAGNSLLGEHWSARTATALFEHEQMHEIAAIPEFNVAGYPTPFKLSSSFKAVAQYMKSRSYRKVNRDVFVMSFKGFDMHKADTLVEKFGELNAALSDFVDEVKSQGLWESTVIVQGSDFGRTMNTNANAGTDHAWGGNYFMAGGSLNGGKIKGKFPATLSAASDYWLKRGRWIPTTPWEAIWNGVVQWMGVHDEADLDWVLPNRDAFKADPAHTLCDLFTDKDLFVDGACECVDENGVESMVCDDITYAPTLVPTESPSASPSRGPTTTPTAAPTLSPSSTPSETPSEHPTADLPDDGALVANVFADEDAPYIVTYGCKNQGSIWKSFDGKTGRYTCDRRDAANVLHQDVTQGVVITPSHGRLTIVKGFRVYPTDVCLNCDIKSYKMWGRVNATAEWELAHEGELPWSSGTGRNVDGENVTSTYDSGDDSLTYTEVRYHGHSDAYLDYKLELANRNMNPVSGNPTNHIRWSELEFPGMILPPEPSVSPTLAPSRSPTVSPTDSPSVSPTKKPTSPPTVSPTTSPTASPSDSPSAYPSYSPSEHPTADLPDDGALVANVFAGEGVPEVSSFGCKYQGKLDRIFNGVTNQYSCDRRDSNNTLHQDVAQGIIVTPSHGRLSIVKGLRVYSHSNCKGCDVVSYSMWGRVNATAEWEPVHQGDLPWKSAATNDPELDRNTNQTLTISSTYESGDDSLTYTEVRYHGHSEAFLDYKFDFTIRSPTKDYVRWSQIELPGMILPPEPSVSPTLAPSRSPTVSPTDSPSVSPTKKPTSPPTVSPTTSPTNSPSDSPSAYPSYSPSEHPTADLPDDGALVANVFAGEVDPYISNFGCRRQGTISKTFDGTTGRYTCDRRDSNKVLHQDVTQGIIITPSHGRLTIIKGFRVYPSDTCYTCDIKSYKMWGRVNATAEWELAHEGDVPWSSGTGRNVDGQTITSTYESGDDSLTYTEVRYHGHSDAYLDYKLELANRKMNPLTGSPTNHIRWTELEFPGMILPPEP